MFDQLVFPGTLSATLASALVAGVFLTFSDFVMRSLRASDPQAGAEAMQQINRKVYTSLFMVFFMGLVPLSATLFALADVAGNSGAALAIRAGAVLYVFGVFGVTAARNVPMNKRLDTLSLVDGSAASYWPDYAVTWTRWNHVRTLASVAAAASFFAGALQLAMV